MKKKILNFIKKKNKSKIVSLTAYSKNIASILDIDLEYDVKQTIFFLFFLFKKFFIFAFIILIQ